MAEVYAGLDVSDKSTHVCVMDGSGAVLWAGACATDPEVIARTLKSRAPGLVRVVLETVELTRRQFGEVDTAFAYDEGEDDRTLADWREAHTAYFIRRGEFSPDMELYCERFRLVEVLERE